MASLWDLMSRGIDGVLAMAKPDVRLCILLAGTKPLQLFLKKDRNLFAIIDKFNISR